MWPGSSSYMLLALAFPQLSTPRSSHTSTCTYQTTAGATFKGKFINNYSQWSQIVYFSDNAISAQNLLNILLASTNINRNTFNQNPFPSQFGQNQNENENQASSATNLISSLSVIFRSSPQVAHNLRTGSSLARGGVSGRNYQTQ